MKVTGELGHSCGGQLPLNCAQTGVERRAEKGVRSRKQVGSLGQASSKQLKALPAFPALSMPFPPPCPSHTTSITSAASVRQG